MTRLKYERLQLGISQEALGIAAHVDQSDIAQMELGRYFPRTVVLDRLARVLGVPSEYLLRPVEIIKPEASAAAESSSTRDQRGDTPAERLERARRLVATREAELAAVLRGAARAQAAKGRS